MTKLLRVLALFSLVVATLAGAGGRRVIKKISIPGDYGWDYLTADSEGRRLYVSHDKEVVVLDLDSGSIVGTIPGQDVHGIAIVRELGRGFISATDQSLTEKGSVTIFDLKTLAVIGKTPVGEDPNAIFYDRKTQRVITADRGSKRVSAIDPRTGNVTGKLEGLAGKTEHAVSDDAGHLFLNIQDLHKLLRIDAQKMKVTGTWGLGPCELPSSMDMDRENNRVFVGCRNGLMAAVDGATGKVVTTLPIGKGVDATEFESATGLIYFSSGADGTLSIFHEDSPDKYSLVERVKTQAGARTMALDHKTGKVYLSVADFGPRPEAAPGKAPGRAPMIPGTFSVLVVGK